MGFYFVDPKTYRQYKDEIIKLSHAIQINAHEHLPAEQRQSGLSDNEIAKRLGIEERVVREIRCVAERDKYPIDEFEAAIRFKDKACRNYAERGMSSVMKKYVERARKTGKSS